MKLNQIAIALVAVVCSSVLAADKPNVVFILSDDQSWDSFGFVGGKVHTPRLDQMAKDGLYLSNFNVTSTVCSLSRYSFLTGRYAGRCEGERFMREHPPGDQTQVENIGELHPKLDRPYLTRNGHLGHYAAEANPQFEGRPFGEFTTPAQTSP